MLLCFIYFFCDASGWCHKPFKEYFVKSKKVAAIGGQAAQTLASWTTGMLRDK